MPWRTVPLNQGHMATDLSIYGCLTNRANRHLRCFARAPAPDASIPAVLRPLADRPDVAVLHSARCVCCKKQKVYLEGGGKVYTCSCCRAHLATRDHVVSEVRTVVPTFIDNFLARDRDRRHMLSWVFLRTLPHAFHSFMCSGCTVRVLQGGTIVYGLPQFRELSVRCSVRCNKRGELFFVCVCLVFPSKTARHRTLFSPRPAYNSMSWSITSGDCRLTLYCSVSMDTAGARFCLSVV